jgi:hypothetical protein
MVPRPAGTLAALLLLATVPVCSQALPKLPVVSGRSVRAAQHDHVEAGEPLLVLPKRLPDNALYPVPARGRLAMFLRDSKPKPGRLPFILPTEHGKPFVSAARSFFEHARERCRRSQPVGLP